MKWKSSLIENVTLIVQMSVLYVAWLYKWLVAEDGPLFAAIYIFVIGVISSFILASQQADNGSQSRKLELGIRLVGALILTAGAFLVVIPVSSIIAHSALAVLLFLSGILAPWLLPKIMKMKYA